MNRRKAMQYLASLAAGATGIGTLTGCVHGGSPRGERKPPRKKATPPNTSASSHQRAPRNIRAQNMYMSTEMAPGVDIEEYGFKYLMILPATSFVDGDGMSVRSKMQRIIAERLSRIPKHDFRGPFILDMEGPRYIGGLKSSDPQTYEMAARRMNAAVSDLLSISPGALVSTYSSPHLHGGRRDFAVARRAIQRMNNLTFYNPSLYDRGPRPKTADEEKDRANRVENVQFACETAKQLGVPYVMPMVNHRYKEADNLKNKYALTVIGKKEFQTKQIGAARDGGAHGIVLWQADLYRKKVADRPSKSFKPGKLAVIRREFSNVTMAELAKIHRNALRWTAEAFLRDD